MMNKEQALNVLKNTFIDFEMVGEIKVKMTLSFYLVKQMESKFPELVERYFKVQNKQQNGAGLSADDTILIFYMAYVCANMDDPDMMDEEAFTILFPNDVQYITQIANRLTGKKN